MKRVLLISLCILSCAPSVLHTQPSHSVQPSKYAFQLTRILLKDGSMKTGWLLGTSGDSLLAQLGGKSERISRTDLLRVDVEAGSQKGKATLAGMLMGIYVGDALALTAKEQPFLYMRHTDEGELALYTALFGLVGGLMGYLAGGAGDQMITFDFSGDEADAASAWEALVEGHSQAGQKRSFHFSLQGAWVNGPLPKPDGAQASPYFYYGGSQATSLNMGRKMQLTYSLNDFIDVGLACVWLGQPTVGIFGLDYGFATASLDGTGLYAVGVFQPLWKLGWRTIQWDIGAGVGWASQEFTASVAPYQNPSWIPIETKAHSISTLLYTELKVYLADYFSLGVVADWVYVPEKVPEIQEFVFEAKHLSTTSIGFVLSFHI